MQIDVKIILAFKVSLHTKPKSLVKSSTSMLIMISLQQFTLVRLASHCNLKKETEKQTQCKSDSNKNERAKKKA